MAPMEERCFRYQNGLSPVCHLLPQLPVLPHSSLSTEVIPSHAWPPRGTSRCFSASNANMDVNLDRSHCPVGQQGCRACNAPHYQGGHPSPSPSAGCPKSGDHTHTGRSTHVPSTMMKCSCLIWCCSGHASQTPGGLQSQPVVEGLEQL